MRFIHIIMRNTMKKSMNMKKNKSRIIKYQRKEIQISNPLEPAHEKQPTQPALVVQEKGDTGLQSSRSEKLELPKSMKVDNTVSDIRKKLIAILESDDLLLPVDLMFENSEVRKITGSENKNTRESFGKREKQPTAQEQREPVVSKNAHNNYREIIIPQQRLPSENSFNFLDLISEEESLHSAFQNQQPEYIPRVVNPDWLQFERDLPTISEQSRLKPRREKLFKNVSNEFS